MFKLELEGVVEIYSDKRGKLAEFSNIFLDSGINFLGTNTLPGYIWVGSGNSAPLPGNTSLDAFIARVYSTSPIISDARGTASEAPYYAWSRKGVRFNAGTAAGNLSEVGLGTSNKLITRALIKDANGIPTSLTILSDEILDISYTVRVYAPTEDATGTITLTGNIGGTYSWVCRASAVTELRAGDTGWGAEASANYRGSLRGYTGGIGGITQYPTGSSLAGTIAANPVYNSIENSVVFSLEAGTTQMNLVGGIKSIRFTAGHGQYQMEFTPAIPKTELDSFSLQVKIFFGRYTP